MKNGRDQQIQKAATKKGMLLRLCLNKREIAIIVNQNMGR